VTENSIELVELTKKYGTLTAVDHLNLSIGKGEIFGLLGPNGAGKSTAILMMLGLTEPDSGTVTVNGIDPVSRPIEVKKKVGYLPEDVGFYKELTGRENLLYTARLNGIPDEKAHEEADRLINRIGLAGSADKKVSAYSRGMRQRLGLAGVLIKDPEVIILDEPTLGIDPTGVRDFLNLIVTLGKEEGITVLFSSHHLHQVQQVCDRVGIFVDGKLLAEGDIRSLSQKLFKGNPYIIEVALDVNNMDDDERLRVLSVEGMKSVVKDIDGIERISLNREVFSFECSYDVSRQIARTLLDSGVELYMLNRKEFGLDEIYYRYFEGGEHHE
jgi:ABC-2 type transport system ATP-binding protein